MYCSVTYFKVNTWLAALIFQWHAFRSYNQANSSIGLVRMNTWSQKARVFCTLTGWESKEAMLAFRNSKAHLTAMKISSKLGAGVTHGWLSESYPSREEALVKLKNEHEAFLAAA